MAQNMTQTQGTNGTASETFTPRVDIFESEQELTLFADLPGVKAEDLDLHFEQGELIVRASCQPRGCGQALRQEYGVGDFYRAFTVTEDVASDKISAELKNGVLTVHLPKAEKSRPRKIQVAAS